MSLQLFCGWNCATENFHFAIASKMRTKTSRKKNENEITTTSTKFFSWTTKTIYFSRWVLTVFTGSKIGLMVQKCAHLDTFYFDDGTIITYIIARSLFHSLLLHTLTQIPFLHRKIITLFNFFCNRINNGKDSVKSLFLCRRSFCAIIWILIISIPMPPSANALETNTTNVDFIWFM